MTNHLRYQATFAVRTSTALVCSLVVLAVMIIPAGARAEYRLSIGDTVHVYVFGQEELDRRATVDGDGKIWVPSLGRMQAAGRTLQELRESLSSVLTTNESIRASDINVDVIEFRPFYIDGDVTKPGAYPYQIGLTVRQAIALAGGIVRAAPEQNYLSTLAEQQASYQGLWSQYIHRHARVARLKAELEGRDRVGWTPPSNSRVLPEVAQRIAALEEKQFEARVAIVERKKADLDEAISLVEAEIAQLELQGQKEEDQEKAMSRTLSTLESLRERGVVPLVRLWGYESAVFGFRFRLDSTKVQLARARQKGQELVGKREQMELAHRAELTGELQGTVMEMDVLRSQMIAAASRLLNSNAVIDNSNAVAVIESMCALPREEGILIHRQKNGQNKRLPANVDSDVRPGDVIEVNVVNEALRAQCLSQNLGTAQMSAGEEATQ